MSKAKIKILTDAKGRYVIYKRKKLRLPNNKKQAQKIIDKLKEKIRAVIKSRIGPPRAPRQPNIHVNIKIPTIKIPSLKEVRKQLREIPPQKEDLGKDILLAEVLKGKNKEQLAKKLTTIKEEEKQREKILTKNQPKKPVVVKDEMKRLLKDFPADNTLEAKALYNQDELDPEDRIPDVMDGYKALLKEIIILKNKGSDITELLEQEKTMFDFIVSDKEESDKNKMLAKRYHKAVLKKIKAKPEPEEKKEAPSEAPTPTSEREERVENLEAILTKGMEIQSDENYDTGGNEISKLRTEFDDEIKNADSNIDPKDEKWFLEIKPRLIQEANSVLGFPYQEGIGKNQVSKKGLSNFQINDIMKNYPQYLGTISHNEIENKILPKVNNAEQCFIINTDPISKGGEHWQCCYWNPAKGEICFYDSYGDLPSPVVYRGLVKIAQKIDNKNHLKFKINRVCQQGQGGKDVGNCGFFCIRCLIDLLKGKTFPEATGFDKQGEKEIEQFKSKIGFGYLPSFGNIDEPFDENIAYGKGILDTLKKGVDWVKQTLFFPKNKLPNDEQRKFDEVKNILWDRLQVRREPIASAVDKALNVISLGAFESGKKQLNYDKMFHLSLIAHFHGRKFLIEKNERIRMSWVVSDNANTEYKEVSLKGQPMSLGLMFDKTLKNIGDFKFFQYNAFSNNCQDFIYNLLSSTNLLTPELTTFIKQDAQTLVKKLPGFVSKLSQFSTDMAGKIKEFFGLKKHGRVHGRGVDLYEGELQKPGDWDFEEEEIPSVDPDLPSVIPEEGVSSTKSSESKSSESKSSESSESSSTKSVEIKQPEEVQSGKYKKYRKNGIRTVFHEIK